MSEEEYGRLGGKLAQAEAQALESDDEFYGGAEKDPDPEPEPREEAPPPEEYEEDPKSEPEPDPIPEPEPEPEPEPDDEYEEESGTGNGTDASGTDNGTTDDTGTNLYDDFAVSTETTDTTVEPEADYAVDGPILPTTDPGPLPEFPTEAIIGTSKGDVEFNQETIDPSGTGYGETTVWTSNLDPEISQTIAQIEDIITDINAANDPANNGFMKVDLDEPIMVAPAVEEVRDSYGNILTPASAAVYKTFDWVHEDVITAQKTVEEHQQNNPLNPENLPENWIMTNVLFDHDNNPDTPDVPKPAINPDTGEPMVDKDGEPMFEQILTPPPEKVEQLEIENQEAKDSIVAFKDQIGVLEHQLITLDEKEKAAQFWLDSFIDKKVVGWTNNPDGTTSYTYENFFTGDKEQYQQYLDSIESYNDALDVYNTHYATIQGGHNPMIPKLDEKGDPLFDENDEPIMVPDFDDPLRGFLVRQSIGEDGEPLENEDGTPVLEKLLDERETIDHDNDPNTPDIDNPSFNQPIENHWTHMFSETEDSRIFSTELNNIAQGVHNNYATWSDGVTNPATGEIIVPGMTHHIKQHEIAWNSTMDMNNENSIAYKIANNELDSVQTLVTQHGVSIEQFDSLRSQLAEGQLGLNKHFIEWNKEAEKQQNKIAAWNTYKFLKEVRKNHAVQNAVIPAMVSAVDQGHYIDVDSTQDRRIWFEGGIDKTGKKWDPQWYTPVEFQKTPGAHTIRGDFYHGDTSPTGLDLSGHAVEITNENWNKIFNPQNTFNVHGNIQIGSAINELKDEFDDPIWDKDPEKFYKWNDDTETWDNMNKETTIQLGDELSLKAAQSFGIERVRRPKVDPDTGEVMTWVDSLGNTQIQMQDVKPDGTTVTSDEASYQHYKDKMLFKDLSPLEQQERIAEQWSGRTLEELQPFIDLLSVVEEREAGGYKILVDRATGDILQDDDPRHQMYYSSGMASGRTAIYMLHAIQTKDEVSLKETMGIVAQSGFAGVFENIAMTDAHTGDLTWGKDVIPDAWSAYSGFATKYGGRLIGQDFTGKWAPSIPISRKDPLTGERKQLGPMEIINVSELHHTYGLHEDRERITLADISLAFDSDIIGTSYTLGSVGGELLAGFGIGKALGFTAKIGGKLGAKLGTRLPHLSVNLTKTYSTIGRVAPVGTTIEGIIKVPGLVGAKFAKEVGQATIGRDFGIGDILAPRFAVDPVSRMSTTGKLFYSELRPSNVYDLLLDRWRPVSGRMSTESVFDDTLGKGFFDDPKVRKDFMEQTKTMSEAEKLKLKEQMKAAEKRGTFAMPEHAQQVIWESTPGGRVGGTISTSMDNLQNFMKNQQFTDRVKKEVGEKTHQTYKKAEDMKHSQFDKRTETMKDWASKQKEWMKSWSDTHVGQKGTGFFDPHHFDDDLLDIRTKVDDATYIRERQRHPVISTAQRQIVKQSDQLTPTTHMKELTLKESLELVTGKFDDIVPYKEGPTKFDLAEEGLPIIKIEDPPPPKTIDESPPPRITESPRIIDPPTIRPEPKLIDPDNLDIIPHRAPETAIQRVDDFSPTWKPPDTVDDFPAPRIDEPPRINDTPRKIGDEITWKFDEPSIWGRIDPSPPKIVRVPIPLIPFLPKGRRQGGGGIGRFGYGRYGRTRSHIIKRDIGEIKLFGNAQFLSPKSMKNFMGTDFKLPKTQSKSKGGFY